MLDEITARQLVELQIYYATEDEVKRQSLKRAQLGREAGLADMFEKLGKKRGMTVG